MISEQIIKHEGYVYLASPYSHPDAEIQYDREQTVTELASALTVLGLNLFCPITQSSRLKEFIFTESGDLSHERWMEIDIEFLRNAIGIIVFDMDGWRLSKGVTEEIEYAEKHGIPVFYVGDFASLTDLVLYVRDHFSFHFTEVGRTLYEGTGFNTPVGVKDSQGKERVGLIPYDAEVAIAGVREFGNKKYKDPAAWYQYPEREDDFVEAAKRHLGKHIDGKLYGVRSLINEESGLPHLDHALASLAMAVALRDKPKEAK